MEEPQIPGVPTEARSSVKFVRNAKGDTQIEVKVLQGDTREQLEAARQIAFETYKWAVEQAGGKLPEVQA